MGLSILVLRRRRGSRGLRPPVMVVLGRLRRLGRMLRLLLPLLLRSRGRVEDALGIGAWGGRESVESLVGFESTLLPLRLLFCLCVFLIL
ncbi:hypothetical protein AOQ84DRAFT_125293 [Glonium stellatum]|uniref:Uncharacterized protein n=1 Tax=Glonium stellatum TaxID=574774 RepID=A0A8E2ETN9_9PEZI|nr:hypothetical protein AOQ84DRAFT_125293 [Glonium stellatum]